MPIYTYRCRECGHQFEQRQRMSDSPLTVCPVCEGNIRRVVNSVGVVFKGSGFYVTDNRGSNNANSQSKTTSPDPKTKTESKTTAPKTESKNTTTTSATAAA